MSKETDAATAAGCALGCGALIYWGIMGVILISAAVLLVRAAFL